MITNNLHNIVRLGEGGMPCPCMGNFADALPLRIFFIQKPFSRLVQSTAHRRYPLDVVGSIPRIRVGAS